MTFSITVPNANQSPGDFPPQNNDNFRRLKDIINAEHNFTDTTSVAQGIHKQCTFINRDPPVGLTAGNGILFSDTDDLGASQLYWFNGATTPVTNSGEKLIASGSIAINTTSTAVMTSVPANSFGYFYMWIPGGQLKSASFTWQSNATTVSFFFTPGYVGSSLANPAIPIINASNITLGIIPKTLQSAYNGTWQYRVFQVV